MMKKANFVPLLLLVNLLSLSCRGEGAAAMPSSGPSVSADGLYVNPVLRPGTFGGTKIGTLADPFVFKDIDGTYYLYVTGRGFPVFSSRNLVDWTYCGRVFPQEGVRWAKTNGAFWAPEVIRFKGKYYLHYSAESRDEKPLKRIGMAVADSPAGPFVDVADAPFYQHAEDKGCIDSHIFTDSDGKMYMYYSNAMSSNLIEGTTDKHRSEIWVVKLKDDLSGTDGKAVMVAWPEQNWENLPNRTSFWNEGACVFKRAGKYYLMYSANSYSTPRYAVGYAVADSPMGPFTKYASNPVLSTVPGVVSGPGHHCVVESPDGTEMFCVYHSHADVASGGGVRMINIDRMGIRNDGMLYITGPTFDGQPYPSGSR